MGERDWMHESEGPETGADRLARRFATTDWLSGPKFVQLLVGIVVVCVIAVIAAALLS